jgi:hypothetical protein
VPDCKDAIVGLHRCRDRFALGLVHRHGLLEQNVIALVRCAQSITELW